MIGRWWQRLMSKIRRPSSDTLCAKRRLDAVRQDDERIADVLRVQRQIVADNHLGHMVAQLFEEHRET